MGITLAACGGGGRSASGLGDGDEQVVPKPPRYTVDDDGTILISQRQTWGAIVFDELSMRHILSELYPLPQDTVFENLRISEFSSRNGLFSDSSGDYVISLIGDDGLDFEFVQDGGDLYIKSVGTIGADVQDSYNITVGFVVPNPRFASQTRNIQFTVIENTIDVRTYETGGVAELSLLSLREIFVDLITLPDGWAVHREEYDSVRDTARLTIRTESGALVGYDVTLTGEDAELFGFSQASNVADVRIISQGTINIDQDTQYDLEVRFVSRDLSAVEAGIDLVVQDIDLTIVAAEAIEITADETGRQLVLDIDSLEEILLGLITLPQGWSVASESTSNVTSVFVDIDGESPGSYTVVLTGADAGLFEFFQDGDKVRIRSRETIDVTADTEYNLGVRFATGDPLFIQEGIDVAFQPYNLTVIDPLTITTDKSGEVTLTSLHSVSIVEYVIELPDNIVVHGGGGLISDAGAAQLGLIVDENQNVPIEIEVTGTDADHFEFVGGGAVSSDGRILTHYLESVNNIDRSSPADQDADNIYELTLTIRTPDNDRLPESLRNKEFSRALRVIFIPGTGDVEILSDDLIVSIEETDEITAFEAIDVREIFMGLIDTPDGFIVGPANPPSPDVRIVFANSPTFLIYNVEIVGADSDLFEFVNDDGQARIQSTNPLDFEAPMDEGEDNIYNIGLRYQHGNQNPLIPAAQWDVTQNIKIIVSDDGAPFVPFPAIDTVITGERIDDTINENDYIQHWITQYNFRVHEYLETLITPHIESVSVGRPYITESGDVRVNITYDGTTAPVGITFTGPDADFFEFYVEEFTRNTNIRTTGTVDYENPADEGRNNIYDVTVTFDTTDPNLPDSIRGATITQPVQIAVQDVRAAGFIRNDGNTLEIGDPFTLLTETDEIMTFTRADGPQIRTPQGTQDFFADLDVRESFNSRLFLAQISIGDVVITGDRTATIALRPEDGIDEDILVEVEIIGADKDQFRFIPFGGNNAALQTVNPIDYDNPLDHDDDNRYEIAKEFRIPVTNRLSEGGSDNTGLSGKTTTYGFEFIISNDPSDDDAVIGAEII